MYLQYKMSGGDDNDASPALANGRSTCFVSVPLTRGLAPFRTLKMPTTGGEGERLVCCAAWPSRVSCCVMKTTSCRDLWKRNAALHRTTVSPNELPAWHAGGRLSFHGQGEL